VRLLTPLLWFAAIAPYARHPASADPAPADPLWQAEVRAGYGVAVGGSGTRMSKRASPLSLAAVAAWAFNEDPLVYGYGGLIVETLDRNEAGATFGVRLSPHGSRFRLAGGGVWMVAPSMVFGATASGGTCMRWKPLIGLCADLQLTAFFAGDDLAAGRAVTEVQLMVGMVFDVL
jgi:hypothetical protein